MKMSTRIFWNNIRNDIQNPKTILFVAILVMTFLLGVLTGQSLL